MYKKILRILTLMLALLLLFGISPSQESAAAQSKEDRLIRQITDTYATALRSSNRYSFHGACGAYANWHAYLLGINTGFHSANGNQQYDLYEEMEYTTGGYRVEALPASKYNMKDALNYLSENGTKDVYNLIIGFQRTNTSAGRKYGHVTFVHAIIDGKVYYSESFGTTINGTYYPEGSAIVVTIDQFYNAYRSWTTYEGTIHFGLKTYQDQCEFFPAYLYATVTNQTQLYTAACTPDVSHHSLAVRTLQPGERLSVIGMYRNTKGEYWYEVEDAEIGYVPASDTQMETLRYDDVAVSGVSAPTEHRKGNVFNIKGQVQSTYTNICSIRAQVFTITDKGLKHWMTTTDQVGNDFYELSYSVVSNRMAFRQLGEGNYRYEMAVVVSSNYYADGLLRTQWTTLKLWCSDFRVVAKKGNSASVQFNTCGGSANLNASQLELGATIGTLPTATREGYVFQGWFTAEEGGELIREDYVLQDDITLYAQWAKDTASTGWHQEDGRPYYVIDGHRVEGFFQADGISYYQGQDGFLVTGWLVLDDMMYYFNANGSMVMGWLELPEGRYYFGTDGTATIGWAQIGDQTYYFDETGKMLTGQHTIEDTLYTFGEDGALITQ